LHPDAVILDIIMPVMSGTEMYAAMQGDPGLAQIPVIISTSDPSRAPSGVLIMRKPIDVPRLLAAVKSVCKKTPAALAGHSMFNPRAAPSWPTRRQRP